MKKTMLALALTVSLGAGLAWAYRDNNYYPPGPSDATINQHFEDQGISLSREQVSAIRENVKLAVQDMCRYPQGTSKVGFTAVEMAHDLGLNPKVDSTVSNRIRKALEGIAEDSNCGSIAYTEPPIQSWEEYYNKTLALNTDGDFLSLLNEKQFSPVKISWEDISRYQGSVWGDRISDVGIWVRKNESDPDSAQLALSVRRDENYRDKILLVPSDKIKVHLKQYGRTSEVSLPERLRQLGLLSKTKDKNVIVSNQFAVVPVPERDMNDIERHGTAPRVAFNFSIYPYGSTNYVITDVIEGSSDAIVGPGNHQALYANINGKKAPFTASRAEDRPDLMRLESELKKRGMDVDVQRYYLIQIPIRKNAPGVALSNMGTPPTHKMWYGYGDDYAADAESSLGNIAAPASAAPQYQYKSAAKAEARQRAGGGFTKVAIGHGEAEGVYHTGSGFRGQRAEEPIRVTVVYFVTPVGEVTKTDMDKFAEAFEAWDKQAIWGGSFVTDNNKTAFQ